MGVNALVDPVASVTISEGGSGDVQITSSLADGPALKPLAFVTLSSPQKWRHPPPLAWNQPHLVNQSPAAV